MHLGSHRGLGWLPVQFPVSSGEEWDGGREGLKWLVSANTNTCGLVTSEISRVSAAAVLTPGSFFGGEICWVSATRSL